MLPKMPYARIVRPRVAIACMLFSALVAVGLVLLTRAAVAQLAPTDTKPSVSDRIDALEAKDDRPIQKLGRPEQVALTLAASEAESRRPHESQSGASAGRDASVPAPVLTGIQIDGDLSDWPAAMPRYAIGKLLTGVDQIGTGGLEDADLSTSPDLSASFSVGYDPKKELIYLAVIVRDDEIIVENNSWLDTDACEVYVDGLHSDAQIPLPDGWPESADASQLPVQQYIATPGPGQVYGFKKYDTNPKIG